MRIAIRYLDQLVEDHKAELTREAEDLSPAELSALPNAKLYGVGPDEVRTTRAKLQKTRAGKPPATNHSG